MKSAPHHQEMRARIDAHFAGRGDARHAPEMLSHLVECNDCKRYFERHQLLASLDPKAPSPADRIGASLGLAPQKKAAGLLPFALVSTLAATGLVLVLVFRGTDPADFVPRGDGGAQVVAWKQGAHDDRLALGRDIGAQDALAFAYTNPANKPYLAIFAVDDTGAVYWYAPTWSDAASTPLLPPAAPGPGPHTVPVATKHAFVGTQLRLYGALLDRPLSVRDVEDRIGKHAATTTPADPDGVFLIATLQVRR